METESGNGRFQSGYSIITSSGKRLSADEFKAFVASEGGSFVPSTEGARGKIAAEAHGLSPNKATRALYGEISRDGAAVVPDYMLDEASRGADGGLLNESDRAEAFSALFSKESERRIGLSEARRAFNTSTLSTKLSQRAWRSGKDALGNQLLRRAAERPQSALSKSAAAGRRTGASLADDARAAAEEEKDSSAASTLRRGVADSSTLMSSTTPEGLAVNTLANSKNPLVSAGARLYRSKKKAERARDGITWIKGGDEGLRERRAEVTAKRADKMSKRQKERYARRAIGSIKQAIERAEVIQGRGLALRLASTARAFAATTWSAITSALSGLVAAGAPALVPIAAVGLVLVAMFSGGWGGGGSRGNHGALTGTAAEVYDCLAGYGFSDAAIAGVLGNMEAESGMDPNVDADDGYGTISMGLMQMVGDERICFRNWCSEKGLEWNTTQAQMEWTFSEEPGTSSFKERWTRPSRVGDSYTSAPAYEGYFGSDWYKSGDEYKAADDVKLAAFTWMACYEGCATGWVSHLDNRISYAQSYLDQINNGGGGNAGSAGSPSGGAGGNAITAAAEQCLGTPYVYGGEAPGSGIDCSGLTMYSYAQAGISIPHGSQSQYEDCKSKGGQVLTDIEQASPGDIIWWEGTEGLGPTGNSGHVAIYMGNHEMIEASYSQGRVVRSSTDGRGWTGILRYPGSVASGGGWNWWGPSSGGNVSNVPASEKGAAIIAAAQSTPSPGGGRCLEWVNNVYEAAGHPFARLPGAVDVYNAYCNNTDFSQIEPGAVLAVPDSGTAMGSIYGHIGIYIGNGQVMDNIGYIRTIPLETWISSYKTQARWGWPA